MRILVPTPPPKSLTFCHSVNSWIASDVDGKAWFAVNQWLAQTLFDNGWRLLDEA